MDLPTPGSPPRTVTEPGDKPAAENPVELANSGRRGNGAFRADRTEGQWRDVIPGIARRRKPGSPM